MKYSHLVVFFLLTTTLAIGQNKEKIKGSKTVVEKPKETTDELIARRLKEIWEDIKIAFKPKN